MTYTERRSAGYKAHTQGLPKTPGFRRVPEVQGLARSGAGAGASCPVPLPPGCLPGASAESHLSRPHPLRPCCLCHSVGPGTAPCEYVHSPPDPLPDDIPPALLLTLLGFAQVSTNGLIAMSEPPAGESHPGLFPPTFGAVAPFLADLDTTDGLGKVYYREDLSPSVAQLAADHVQRGFPDVPFQPSGVVVVTWESVAPYRGPGEDPAQEGEVSTHPGAGARGPRVGSALFGPVCDALTHSMLRHREGGTDSSRLVAAGLNRPAPSPPGRESVFRGCRDGRKPVSEKTGVVGTGLINSTLQLLLLWVGGWEAVSSPTETLLRRSDRLK